MAATTNKQQVLNQCLALLKKKYGEPEAVDESRNVLEEVLYAICREGATKAQTDPAFDRLRKNFFDWNEVRVTSEEELSETLAGLPDPADRARRIIGILQELFEETFSFDLESTAKAGVKQAAKQLSRYADVSDFAASWVVQHALGGHAVPLDTPTIRVLVRLGVLSETEDNLESLRATVEHFIPKAKDGAFNEWFSELASEICVEDEPKCSQCPLLKECPTGQMLKDDAGKGGKLKSR